MAQSECREEALSFAWQLRGVAALPGAPSAAAAEALVSRAESLWDIGAARGLRSTSLLLPPYALAAGVAYDFRLCVGTNETETEETTRSPSR